MWQANTNDYKARIRQELATQVNAEFLYFLLQEAIRLLENRQQAYKKKLSWFSKEYRHNKTFIKRSQAVIHSFAHLSLETGKLQLSKLFASLSAVHNLLRENCTNESILAFVAASEEARRYNDFSGQVYYAIKSPLVKLCFDLSSEYYQKQVKKLYEKADELALVPRIQSTLGLDRIPQAVKQSVFYKIGQRTQVEEMWLDAAFPHRLATPASINNSRLNTYSDDLSVSASVSFERCKDLRKQAGLSATRAQQALSALCRIHDNSLLSDIEKAAMRIKRFTLTKKTGRRSVMLLVQALKALRQFDHNIFLKVKTQDDLKQIFKKITHLQQSIDKRLQHLKQLPLMRVDLSVVSTLEQSLHEVIHCHQQQAHQYALEAQFIHDRQCLPALKVEDEMRQSDAATEWKKLRLTLLEIADSYRLPVALPTLEGIESLLTSLESAHPLETNAGCLLDPDKLVSVSDLSTLTYFIFARRYANYPIEDRTHTVFMPLEFDKKRGLVLHAGMQGSRFVDLLDILQALKATPLLHYSVRLVVSAMMQASRTSAEYATLYTLLEALLNNGYAAFVSDHHASPSNKHWVMNYLPYAVEARPNPQSTSFVRTRLLGNGYVTSATIFPLPKYAMEEAPSRKVSVDLDMLSGSPEVHRGSMSQSSLRNSLVLVSSSPERRKASVNRLEDMCSQLVIHAKSIMSKHQDFGIVANYEQNNPVGYNSIRLMHQRAQQNGHDNYLVMIYMLITWYYTRRENKLYTDECSAYQPMLETCFLLGESLIAHLSRPQAIDYKIFERLLNLETKNLASSARKLHTTLLKLIPYAHLGLALSEEDFAFIDTAIKFVNQFPHLFGVNREGMIKDAMVEALIEYRGAHKSLLLMMTLWQAVLSHTTEEQKKSPDAANFYRQADHWQRRARMAMEGGEKAWPSDLKQYLPNNDQLKTLNPAIKTVWVHLQQLSPEFQVAHSEAEEKENVFIALSNENLNKLSIEEAQQEFMRYLTFIFAAHVHLAQEYMDQLIPTWESHGKLATSVKMVMMLLECYELHYRDHSDIGVDKVYSLKKRFENKQYALHHTDMPESIHNRTMAVGYSRLRMVLFSIATPTTPKKTFFGTPTRK